MAMNNKRTELIYTIVLFAGYLDPGILRRPSACRTACRPSDGRAEKQRCWL